MNYFKKFIIMKSNLKAINWESKQSHTYPKAYYKRKLVTKKMRDFRKLNMELE